MTLNNTTYDYDDDYEDQLCRKDDVVKFGSIIIPLFFSIVVVMSCIGNVLVLIILALYESLKFLTNVFILNLALSDLLFTFGLPFWASYFIHGWTFGEIGCKAVKFLFYVGFYSSVLFLTLMTIQRYMAVVHPLSDWEKCRCFSVAPIIIWMMSGTAALVGAHYSKILKDLNNTYCEYESIKVKSGIAYFQNAFFFAAFLIMGFCYCRMLQTITNARTSKRHKTVRLIFSIALVFFIGWAPYNIAMFLRSLTDQNIPPFTICEVSKGVDYAYYLCRLLAFSHCCLNPVFYVFVGVKFRNHLYMILEKILKKKKKLDSSQGRMAKNQSQGSMY
ncbi:chemokine (C motif) receptor 1a, duplicate 1 isoform X1 [Danio rerio]|uniref:Chemokine (C motif) receptor 1a, duplicate 1 n=2 Tax=Danio rerio TaxID=7955 RepID=A0AB13AAP3_DANRE|nr:chemokine (C motif) receptor 1a, duplicate 1 [Danio rerio]|eukprot:XP_001332348.1 chemokine XC receptor 1 [Danio rerio]